MATVEQLLEKVKLRFTETVTCVVEYDQLTLELEPSDLLLCAKILRDEKDFRFEQLIDICGIDYLYYGMDEWDTADATSTGFSRGRTSLHIERRAGEDRRIETAEYAEIERRESETRYNPENRSVLNDNRFAVVYNLISLTNNQRIRLKVFLRGEPPKVPSLVPLWDAANWYEREAFDLFGIYFEGHPDLRRLLTDYGFIGHPFRKDFPLIGQLEMRYDAAAAKVIYEPVSIKPRTLVPKIIRHKEPQNG